MTLIANKIFAFLTVAAQVIFLFGLIYFFIYRQRKNNRLLRFLAERGIVPAFFIALLATLASLFYSVIAGFAPCDLCWYQRIFMYPQVILLGLAWLKKDKNIIDYSLTLALIGGLVSLYHNYLGWAASADVCAVTSGISCLRLYVVELSYITIPLMSLSAFALIVLILAVQKILSQKNKYNDLPVR